jgi:hypothetical protein
MPAMPSRPAATGCRALVLATTIALLAGRPAAAQVQPQDTIIRARIEGSVWDSLSVRPLIGAQVRMVRADAPSIGFSATSSLRGTFAIDNVPAGSWLASFTHPLLDSLRIEPSIVKIDVRAVGTVRAVLAVPSRETMITALCGAQSARNFSRGVVYGTIRGANSDAPIDSTTLLLEWTEAKLVAGRLTSTPNTLAYRADDEGRYVACNLPRDRRIRTVAARGADATGDVELLLPSSGILRRDYLLGLTRGPGVDTTARGRQRATVRGRIVGSDMLVPRSAQLLFRATGEETRIDSAGRFTIANAPLGTHTLEVRAIGYAPYRQVVELRPGDVLELELSLPIVTPELDRVIVRANRNRTADARQVDTRFASGIGDYIDAQTIKERGVLLISDALRGLNGVRLVRSTGTNQGILMQRISGGECEAVIWVDGHRVSQATSTRTAAGDVTLDDLVDRDNVAGIEVYSRLTRVPPQFTDMGNDTCGAIVVWTKRVFPGRGPMERRRMTAAVRDSVRRADSTRTGRDSTEATARPPR